MKVGHYMRVPKTISTDRTPARPSPGSAERVKRRALISESERRRTGLVGRNAFRSRFIAKQLAVHAQPPGVLRLDAAPHGPFRGDFLALHQGRIPLQLELLLLEVHHVRLLALLETGDHVRPGHLDGPG